MIPLFSARRALEPLLPEVADRIQAVIAGGRYILGPEVEAFEAEFADYLGASHVVGVANGTDAITIALRALGIGAGDEVIVPSMTFYASAEAVANAGARPVLCDVDPKTYCMTAETARPLIGERTAALLPVHLCGNPAPMDELNELAAHKGLAVIEDAAQAAGAKLDGRMAGALGDAATFSFFPSKNLGGFGDGGAVVTDDPEVAAQAKQLRFHGSEDKKLHTAVGYNSRLDEIQATGLRVVLPHLEEWTRARRRAAKAYREAGLAEVVELPEETEGAEHCYHLYMVKVAWRDQLQQSLDAAGIGARPYYSTPMHRQPGLAEFQPPEALEHADALGAQNLALPMGPALSDEDVATVVETIRSRVQLRAA